MIKYAMEYTYNIEYRNGIWNVKYGIYVFLNLYIPPIYVQFKRLQFKKRIIQSGYTVL